ncbi:hypothetical protein BS50DRAFT_14920 [Corynespora cassiicola Philippines]|uniref:Rhodopsin domain-containing protein n=1 Tax=Corynespora cassiicola Philippines TaxID=1448308 RepID=A0A2T2P9S1_CORCC|nr:hypothetical protein BS50DRAFT_14920 [Corynespora cassiicola Philippines]
MQSPSQSPEGASRLLGTTGTLYLAVLLVLATRIYTGAQYRRLGWDDHTIVFAAILGLVQWALFFAAVRLSTGQPNTHITLPSELKARQLLYASTVHWSPAMMFTKISMSAMIIRIKRTGPWIVFCYSMIVIQVLACLMLFIFHLVQCLPLSATWNPTIRSNAWCASGSAADITLYVSSGISIATDVMFATILAVCAGGTLRTTRGKVISMGIILFGAFAAASGITRTTLIHRYTSTDAKLPNTIIMVLWSILELQAIMIASCIPALPPASGRLFSAVSPSPPPHHHPHNAYRPTQSTTLFDAHRLPCLHTRISHTQNSMHLDSPSATTKSTIGRSTDTPSQETIWPGGASQRGSSQRGIMCTMEFDVQSEVLSLAPSHGEGTSSEGKCSYRGDSGVGLAAWDGV